MKIIRETVTVVASICLVSTFVRSSDAVQFTQMVNGNEVVVHTNPLPVVIHRLVPPQHGRHVTAREVKLGKVPPPGRLIGQRRR